MATEEANREQKYVHDVYDAIAPHFSATRYKPWPLIVEYLEKLPKHSIIGDIGCGNGKYLSSASQCYSIASDRSPALSQICRSRGFQCLVADVLYLPLRSNSLDHAISIAVIHHLVTPERRLQAIQEMLRVIRPNGTMLLYVWALEQVGKRQYDKQDVLVPWRLAERYVTSLPAPDQSTVDSDVGLAEPVVPAAQLDPTTGLVTFNRYYHMFTRGELEALVLSLPHTEIVSSGYEKDNWYAVVRKLPS